MMKIGIIGCGKIVRVRHAPECAANPQIKLAGFFDFRAERAQELTEEYGGRVYASVEEMLSDQSINGVIVCTSNRTHAEVTIQALKAGKHVLCEKPMCTSVQEAVSMEEWAQKAEKLLMIAHNQRFDQVHIRAKELLKSDVIGEVLNFRSEFSHSGPEGWSIDAGNSWFLNKKEAFIGAMGDLGVHKIDLMRWFLEDDFVSISASVVNMDKKDTKGDPVGIDDCGICILHSKNGVWGTITASWCNYGLVNNSTTFYGTKGVMTIADPYTKNDILVSKGNEIYKYQVGAQESSGVVDAFVDAVINTKESPVSGHEGIECMKLVLGALKSAEEEKMIKII